MQDGRQIFSLRGKTALITGAPGHLGAEMSFALAEAGAHVLINSRSLERSEALVTRLQDAGHSAAPAAFDVTDAVAIDRFFAGLLDQPLHILVNNAYAGGGGNIKVARPADYAASYDITVIAAHNLLKASLPGLRRAAKQDGDASVINIATMYALVSPDPDIYDSDEGTNPPFYGAAKAALIQFTRYAACEFGRDGLRVNSIAPGPFPSREVQTSNPDFICKLGRKVPMGRIGQASEIRGPVVFLASPASSFVNGANLCVDGGWTSW